MKFKNLFFIAFIFCCFSSCSSDDDPNEVESSYEMSVDGVPIEYDMIASYVSVNKDHQSIAVRIDGYTGRIGGHIGVFFNGLENGVINDRLTTFTLTRLSLVSITSGQITYKKEGNLHVLTFDNVSVKESAIPYTTAKINGYVKLNETMGKK